MTKSKGKAICLALMLTVLLPAMASSQPATPVWGEWTVDQTISGCVEIRSGDTLTIYPGVTVTFGAGGKLIVRDGGTLVVNPTDTGCPDQVARVVFTGSGWEGIVVEYGGYFTLRYADIVGATDTGLTVLSGASPEAALNYVTFSGCSGSAGGAIYTEQSLTIQNSSFVGNSASLYGGAIEATAGPLTLQDVLFDGNSAGYFGGAIDLLNANLVMSRGTLTGNSSPAGSALSIYGGGAAILNSFFYAQEDSAVISRVGDTALTIAYSTFNGNAGLAALQGNTDDNVTIAGSILWGNGSSNVDLPLDGGGLAVIQVSDVQGLASLPSDWLAVGNIDADPLFVAAGDYNLQGTSPAIGAAAGADMGVTGGAAAPGPDVLILDLSGNEVADPFNVGVALVGTPIVRTLRLANEGQEAVTVVSAAISGAHAPAYSVSLTPGLLGPGECLNFQITFDPAAPGTYNLADLSITHSAGVLVNGLTGRTQEGSGNNLVLSTVLLDFGPVLVDTTSAPLSVEITNPVANGGLVEVVLTPSGDVGAFTPSETEFMIPAGASRTVWATFTPDALRSFEAIWTPTVNGVERPDLGILLIGSGSEQLFSVSDDEHQFAPTQIGLMRDTTITVTNALAGTSILVTATQPGSGFSVVPPSAAIAASGTADFTVIFSPVAEGFAQAELEFSTTVGPNTQTETVALRGVGIPTGVGIGVSTNLVTFPDTSVGDTSAPQSFTVTNLLDGFVVIDVSGPITGEFDLVTADSFVLFPAGDPRDTRTIQAAFTPSDALLFNDAITVQGVLDGTSINVGTEIVALQGRGTDSDVSIAPDAIDFGDVPVGTTSATVSVSVVNVGTEPLDIFAAILSDTDNFDIVSQSCAILSPLETDVACFYEIAATPQAEDSITGDLSIYTSDSPLPTVIPLSANGTPATAAVISVDPTTVDMGDIAVFMPSSVLPGLATVTVTNAGDTANLIVTGITFSGYHAAQFSAGPTAFVVAPGGTRDVTVNLTATGIGVRATTMTIASNAGNVDVTVTAVSQVGYTNADGLGINPEGLGVSTSHERGERIFVVPGFPVSVFYIQQITTLAALNLPADKFVWLEGPAYLSYIDNTGTWVGATTAEDIQSLTVGSTLSLIPGYVLPAVVPVAEGLYTLHSGFDLVRDNAISEFDVHYVDFGREIVYGPHPSVFLSASTLTVGDPGAALVGLNILYGTSITPVDVYIIAIDANGTTRWWNQGVGQWQTGTPARLFTGAVNTLPSPFAGATIAGATGYAIADPSQVGTHTFQIIYDRSTDNVLNDSAFVATDTIEVVPAP
jgi:hypothetical protein